MGGDRGWSFRRYGKLSGFCLFVEYIVLVKGTAHLGIRVESLMICRALPPSSAPTVDLYRRWIR